jgi:shikimate dehydrogenase
MIKLGLIGYPLSHSFSEKYFKNKFIQEEIQGYQYSNYPITDIKDLRKLILDEPYLKGLNVTIPYKQQVIPFLADLDETARQIGAVNTIYISRDSQNISLRGFNTDVYGFQTSLEPLLRPEHNAALILGTGGASKAVEFVLKSLGISYQFVSRKPASEQLHYSDLCLPVIKNHKLIINTTPLGTYPEVSAFPDIPYDLLGPGHILYDLVYNPAETEFLRLGSEKGVVTQNGLRMLELQAEAAWDIWTE